MKKSAIAIIFNTNKNEVLLVKRRDVAMWVLPGGGIDEGELPAHAAIREALEETGLSVAIERAVAEYSPINRLASTTYTFECHVVGGSLTTGSETRELCFCPLEQLPEPFFFIHRDWLNDALEMSPNVIKSKLTQVTYKNLALYFMRHPIQVLRMLLSRLGIPINS